MALSADRPGESMKKLRIGPVDGQVVLQIGTDNYIAVDPATALRMAGQMMHAADVAADQVEAKKR